MSKKFLIIVSFVLLTYSLLACLKEVESASCSCGDMSIQCMLTPGRISGVAESDDEWYWFNCGSGTYNKIEIRATKGGDYLLCGIENQQPDQCPSITDMCVGNRQDLYLYQGSGQNYWVLVHKNSGNSGYDINLYCDSGPPPAETTTVKSAQAPITYEDTGIYQEDTSSESTNTAWAAIIIVVVLVVILFLYKFIKK